MKRLIKTEEETVILDWLADLDTLGSPPQKGFVLDRGNSDIRNFWTWAKRERVEASPSEVAETIEKLIKDGKVHLLLTEEGPIGFHR